MTPDEDEDDRRTQEMAQQDYDDRLWRDPDFVAGKPTGEKIDPSLLLPPEEAARLFAEGEDEEAPDGAGAG
jgi:hypothetical protein